MQTRTTAPPTSPAPTYAPWGMLATIDLHGCHSGRLADPESIRRFVPAVIDAIGMRAHGALMLDRFGDDELEGWSEAPWCGSACAEAHSPRFLNGFTLFSAED